MKEDELLNNEVQEPENLEETKEVHTLEDLSMTALHQLEDEYDTEETGITMQEVYSTEIDSNTSAIFTVCFICYLQFWKRASRIEYNRTPILRIIFALASLYPGITILLNSKCLSDLILKTTYMKLVSSN